jgi:hypothetical protein
MRLRLNLVLGVCLLLTGCVCSGLATDIIGNDKESAEQKRQDIAWYQQNGKKNVTAYPRQGNCRSWDDGKQVVTVCD